MSAYVDAGTVRVLCEGLPFNSKAAVAHVVAHELPVMPGFQAEMASKKIQASDAYAGKLGEEERRKAVALATIYGMHSRGPDGQQVAYDSGDLTGLGGRAIVARGNSE